MSELQGIFAKARLDIDNIEVLFGAIEMALLTGKLSSRNRKSIRHLRNSIVSLIVRTLERSIEFPVRDRRVYPPVPYDEFVRILVEARQTARQQHDPHSYTFLTFNYDLALDYALHFKRIPYDYCLTDEQSSDTSPYLKLHGSINWGICPKCRQIVPFNLDEVRFNLFPETPHVYFDLGSQIASRQHCNMPLDAVPVLVPPTWNKTDYHNKLDKVWKKASAELATAENIFVVGYSLPESDLFFRYLYALGSESHTLIRRFWVFDPDQDHSVEQRFHRLIGAHIENRFRFIHDTFRESLWIIEDALRNP